MEKNKPNIKINRFSRAKTEINSKEKPIKKPLGKMKFTIIEPKEEEPELKIGSESDDEIIEYFFVQIFYLN